MKLLIESDHLEDYLKEIPGIIEFGTLYVYQQIQKITSQTTLSIERAKMAFEVARDEIKHSFDTGNQLITISAEKTLEHNEGICFAKSHLLVTLLRGMEIPAGFCYQRVLRKGTVESGYALHGLVAIYLDKQWFRVDPRGNKPGIDAQFLIASEKLAYPIRTQLGEIDYPNVYVAPLTTVIDSMRTSLDSQELFYQRPEKI